MIILKLAALEDTHEGAYGDDKIGGACVGSGDHRCGKAVQHAVHAAGAAAGPAPVGVLGGQCVIEPIAYARAPAGAQAAAEVIDRLAAITQPALPLEVAHAQTRYVL